MMELMKLVISNSYSEITAKTYNSKEFSSILCTLTMSMLMSKMYAYLSPEE